MYSLYPMLNLDPISPGLQLQSALDPTADGSPSPALALGFFIILNFPLLSANVSGLKHGFLHYGHGSLLSVWLPHEPHSHCLNKALSRSINVSNSLYCKSGVEAKAKSITQIHHHFKQNYDLWVIHDSINCLLFPVLSEILATIESLGIINSWRRWWQKQFLD